MRWAGMPLATNCSLMVVRSGKVSCSCCWPLPLVTTSIFRVGRLTPKIGRVRPSCAAPKAKLPPEPFGQLAGVVQPLSIFTLRSEALPPSSFQLTRPIVASTSVRMLMPA